MKNYLRLIACMLCMVLLLPACGESITDQSGTDTGSASAIADAAVPNDTGSAVSGIAYVTAEADSDGNLVIDTSSITEYATYVNYDVDGVTIQMILVRDSSGSLHYALNTCQSCTPSPKAYFVQEGSNFVCQNCGNVFTVEQVGSVGGGCNPMNITDAEEIDETLIVSAASLEQYSSNFANWQGPTSL